MRVIRRGARCAAVVEIRGVLVSLGLLAACPNDRTSPTVDPEEFDEAVDHAVRVFQQSRGLTVDGKVGDETSRALNAARWQLGQRTLAHVVSDPMVGDDVHQLQIRLLEMGYDVGRTDGFYGSRTARAVAQFQREVGLSPTAECGPPTTGALHRLGRKVVGGRPQFLREVEVFRAAGPALVGKHVVLDPGHGGVDLGAVVDAGGTQVAEADLTYALVSKLNDRLTSAGMIVHMTRGPMPPAHLTNAQRAMIANDLHADLFISLHVDSHINPEACGVATYHYGSTNGATSTVGERLAELVQREIVARSGLRDCRTHAKTWDLLRMTWMPAVRVDLGYLTSEADRAVLLDPPSRERIVEALVAAVQRIYLPAESDVATGSIDVTRLRELLSARA